MGKEILGLSNQCIRAQGPSHPPTHPPTPCSWSPSCFRLFPKNQCKCDTLKWKESYNFQNAYSQTELPAVKARRQAEFEHFQRR